MVVVEGSAVVVTVVVGGSVVVVVADSVVTVTGKVANTQGIVLPGIRQVAEASSKCKPGEQALRSTLNDKSVQTHL